MDFVAYTVSQRLFMLVTIWFVAWVLPQVVAVPGYGRARVDLSEYSAAYGATRWFGWEPEGAATLVIRTSLMTVGIMTALPEIIGF